MAKESISEKYFEVFMAYVAAPDEKFLVAAAALGLELVMAETPPEEIAELHEEALARLSKKAPETTLMESVRTISAPLIELLMAYGLAFRGRTEAHKLAEEAKKNLKLDSASPRRWSPSVRWPEGSPMTLTMHSFLLSDIQI